MSDEIKFDSITKTWSGPSLPYRYGKASVGEIAFENMIANLNHTCQISDETGESYTYTCMLKKATSFATSLRELGVKPGDVALLFTENHYYIASSWLGCTFAGVIICPFYLPDNSITDETKELIEKINPKIMVTTFLDHAKDFQMLFQKLNINCPIYTYKNKIPGCQDLKPLLERTVDLKTFKVTPIKNPEEDIFMLTVSSGTTGESKVIVTSHKQAIFARILKNQNFTFATTMKPGWTTEATSLYWSFMSCNTRIMRAEFTIEQFLKMVQKYRVNLIFTKPKDIFAITHSEIIDKIDLSCVQFVISTGEHLSVKIAETLLKHLPNGRILNGYSISDLGYGITMPGQELIPNCVGYIKPNVQVRIVNDKEQALGVNEIGEIYVKSIAPFSGFYKDEKLTQESMTADGFFKTGDMGYVDEQGRVFLVERKKCLISYRGDWINQSYIERIIIENVEGVAGVCVVDVEHKEHGNIPVIAIIPKAGVKLNEQEIIQTVQNHSKIRFHTRVFFMEKLPMTISGKYKKFVVRDMILPLMK